MGMATDDYTGCYGIKVGGPTAKFTTVKDRGLSFSHRFYFFSEICPTR